jgi:hypothetical protein
MNDQQLQKMLTACTRLPESKVLAEERHVFDSPILVLTSTVLSLNRKWYAVALPARNRFENGIYFELDPKTLVQFQTVIRRVMNGTSDWIRLSEALWQNRETQKARQLASLVAYFIKWKRENHPRGTDLEACRLWSEKPDSEDFVGKIKGLGPRAYEQLQWYFKDRGAFKLDRHLVNFVELVLGGRVSDVEAVNLLEWTADQIGKTYTELDVQIWDYMQSKYS